MRENYSESELQEADMAWEGCPNYDGPSDRTTQDPNSEEASDRNADAN